jgi:acetyltransferase-like isoleucine patch superfamily enzyme
MSLASRWLLQAIQASDRRRLRRLAAQHPGLQIDPSASTNFARARIAMGAGAVLKIGANVVTERTPGALTLLLGPGAHVEIGERTWLRTELEPIHIAVFAGARLVLGPDSWLNGCHLSAKHAILCGRRAWIGPGCRLIDADQHDLDAEHEERGAPITLGDHVWITSDVTVIRGVQIGSHVVVGSRSLVNRDVPDHTLVHGIPARPHGTVGDRSATP